MSILKFGKDIPTFTKRLRRDMDWTQLNLAEQIGVHPQYVSNVERGKMKTYLSFASLLYNICPRDRKPYLMDLMADASANHAVDRMLAKSKTARLAKKKR